MKEELENKKRKVTLPRLAQMKERGEFIVALGVYDSPMASVADQVGFEMFVIGNSGPMCLLGHKSSTTVSADELLFMTQGVSRVTKHALVIATMPYASLCSTERAITSAARLVSEGGAEGVQCHGNRHTARYIRDIVQAGIPVLAHIGLQSPFKALQGGFRMQGQSAREAKIILEDAMALADAGVFAFTAELVPAEVTACLRERLPVPVLSLGSGSDADGVYLVSGDAVGYSTFPSPRNAKRFAEVLQLMESGLRMFLEDARADSYFTPDQVHHMSEEEYEKFLKMVLT